MHCVRWAGAAHFADRGETIAFVDLDTISRSARGRREEVCTRNDVTSEVRQGRVDGALPPTQGHWTGHVTELNVWRGVGGVKNRGAELERPVGLAPKSSSEC